MDANIRKDIENLKADPDFVEFVMAWHGEIGVTETPFTTERESLAYQKKIKRWTKRDCGSAWKFYWGVIRDECWKARRKLVLRRNLFRLEPCGPNPNHRPQNERRWNAIFDFRQYFIKIDRRPHMRLLGLLFYPDQDEDTFLKEWTRRKQRFKEENGVERLEQLALFYQHNRARIVETLRTRIPFYAKWESASPVNLSLISTYTTRH